jgi:hypothetical protein
MSGPWLPEGAHHDLNIEHHPGRSIGPMTGGGHKGVIHITVSPWYSIDPIYGVLISKGAEPQTVLGGRPGWKLPVLGEMLALTDAGKALRHPGGTPETNRANAVQMEICATVGNGHRTADERAVRDDPYGTGLFHLPDVELPDEILSAAAAARNGSESHAAAALEMIDLCIHEDAELLRAFNSGVGAWTDDTYNALGNAWNWIDNRFPIPLRQARSFQNTTRLTPSEWIKASGYLGHMHCPNNDHIDPTVAFRGRKFVNAIKTAPHAL